MENIQIVEVVNPITQVKSEHVIIDRGNGEFTSMLKFVWDELQLQKDKNNV